MTTEPPAGEATPSPTGPAPRVLGPSLASAPRPSSQHSDTSPPLGRVVALVPAFRRADRVGATVRRVLPLVDQVVVVDDGSGDAGATAAAALEAGATVVVLSANCGKGGALTAGVAATPDADTYLLVDADTAETAAATAPLLERVGRGADLSIGVLPPAGGRGGFGTVRDLATWGIRRACSFEAAAPLSGQRAVRAPLLRSLELADRFGVEVGMTIDAVRAGARVVEVPVEVEHAHTGRGVRGFAHRAEQGWDLVRALWPRLLDERLRRWLLAGLAIVTVIVLAWAAAATVPIGQPLAAAEQVLLVAAPAELRLEDLSAAALPALSTLAGERGAVAAANVNVPGRSGWSSWATVGAGAEVRAGPPSKPPDPEDFFRVQDRVRGQGRLGDALRRSGRTTGFIGADPTSAVRLAVADGDGRIDRAGTVSSLGLPGMVNRVRTELNRGTSLVAVDATELDPVGLEDLLAGIRPVDAERRLLLVVTPAEPHGELRLRPLLASGPGAPAGRLVSPSTRRDGLVLLSDVAPTILATLGVEVPAGMVGRPLRRLAHPPDVQGLVDADRLASQRFTVWNPLLLAVVPLHLACYGWALWRWRRSRDDSSGGRGLRLLALGLAAWPLATWLVRALPQSHSFGRWAGVLALALDTLVVLVASRAGRGRGLSALAVVLGATVVLITVDLGFGGDLQLSSALGRAAHSTTRFTGLGNSAFAVYASSALLAIACARRRAPWMAALLVLVVLAVTLPPLGGDVGGLFTLAPVAAVTVVALWGRLRWRSLVVAAAATVLTLSLTLAVDLSRPADARTHLARYVTGGGRTSSISGKLAQNLGTYASIPPLVLLVAIGAGFAILLWRGRFPVALPYGSPARIGVSATAAVALLGNVVNDTGPKVTLLALGMLAPYLVVRYTSREPPARVLSCLEPAPAPS